MASVQWPVISSWKDPVANAAALPATGNTDGDARVDVSTDTIYIWHDAGSNWLAVATPGAAIALDGLNGDVSASGPGVVSATVNSVGGSTASAVNTATVAANAATNLNTVSTIVKRDSNGDFAARKVTLGTLLSTDTNVKINSSTYALTSGTDEILIGSTAGDSITSGNANVCIGTAAGTAITTGIGNLAIGYQAGQAATTGNAAVLLGYQAGQIGNFSGAANIGIGFQAGYEINSGATNIGIGYTALSGLTTGSNNIAIGTGANVSNIGISNTIALGNTVTVANTNDVAIGNSSNRVGLCGITPSAFLTLPAVTTSAGSASLKITAGTVMTSPENGAVESDGTHLYWTNGSGTRINLAGGGGGGANTALSNLASTAVNVDLRPGSTNTLKLGDSSHQWLQANIQSLYDSTTEVISVSAKNLLDNSGNAAVDWNARALNDSTNTPSINWQSRLLGTPGVGAALDYSSNTQVKIIQSSLQFDSSYNSDWWGQSSALVYTGDDSSNQAFQLSTITPALGLNSAPLELNTGPNSSNDPSSTTGRIEIVGGDSLGVSGSPSQILILGGSASGNGSGSAINMESGGSNNGAAGDFSIEAASGSSFSGNINLTVHTAQGTYEQTSVQTVADSGGSLNNTYFTFHSANNATTYYVWYNVDGTGTDPTPGGTGIEVDISTGDSAAAIADGTVNSINNIASADVTATLYASGSTRFWIVNTTRGPATNASDAGSTGFTISVATQGSDTGVQGVIKNNGPVAYTAQTQSVSAGNSLRSDASFVALSSSGAVDTSTSTVIVAGVYNGQIIQLINSGANTITLKSGGNTKLPNNSDFALTANSSLSCVWYTSAWYTTSASSNS